MNLNLSRFGPFLLSVLRIVAAALFLQHGTQKMFGFPPSSISEGRGRVRIVFDPEAAAAEPGAHPTIDGERLERARPRLSSQP